MHMSMNGLSGVYQHTTQQHLMVYISIQPDNNNLGYPPQLDKTTQQHQGKLTLSKAQLFSSIHT